MANKQTMKKMLPIGIAVGAGALLLYFTTRKANAGQLPPPPDDGSGDGGNNSGGGGNNSDGGGGSNVTAPPFPGQRTSAENGFIDGSYSEWLAALGTAMDAAGNSEGPATMTQTRAAKAQLGIPSSQTPATFYADAGLANVYGFDGRIPSGFNSTWQPWVNAWQRMHNRFASNPLDPTA